MNLEVQRGTLLADQAHGWGQLVHAASGVGRVQTTTAHWVLPAARALWVPPHERPQLHCVTALSLRTLYFAPHALPDLPVRCTVLTLSPLLKDLVLATAGRAPLEDGPHQEGRLLSVLRDELSAAPREPLALPMPRGSAARRLANRILGEPGARRSIDEWCKGCGASRRTLERRFREETGTSLGEWLRQARLQHAVVGLTEGRSVTQVAEEVGYSSASAFVQAFRLAYGTTPGRWVSPMLARGAEPR
ncbi:MAG: helix-turn-helix transcriptional regulator [Myxococcota bacterium]